MTRTTEHPAGTDPNGEGDRLPYEAPQVLYEEELEFMAIACTPTGKGDPVACRLGPIRS